MLNFWDEKFSSTEYIYGKEPNTFLKKNLDNLRPGKILIPGDGEGRNSVYAAKTFWDVTAFDYSKIAIKKANELAKENNVELTYQLSSVEEFDTSERFDVIALVFLHLPEETRIKFHKKIINLLKPNGKIICEFFEKDQINNNSGGPKSIDMLYSIDTLEKDFEDLKITFLSKEIVTLNEGPLHQGEAKLVRMIATKA
jgi:SAM-dependent methyltransferase